MTILVKIVAAAGLVVAAGSVLAQQRPTEKRAAERVEAVLQAAFPRAPAEWAGRIAQD